MIPLVGFLPPDDPRVQGTVAAITTELLHGDFVMRYATEEGVDGLPPGEGVFLPCSFWLADNLALMGRIDEARALFERLVALGNDVGLLSEEYDPVGGRLLGNFPQAMTHVALINTACNLAGGATGPRPALRAGAAGQDSGDERDRLPDPRAARARPRRPRQSRPGSCGDPSAICVQWNGRRAPSVDRPTTPRPRRSSNSTTCPVLLTGRRSPGRIAVTGRSVDDLGDRELDDVRRRRPPSAPGSGC